MDYYKAVAGWIKSVILTALMLAMLVVLISPFPELATSCSSKFAIGCFALLPAVSFSLCEPTLAFASWSSLPVSEQAESVLSKICIRLC
ncbi:MAG: hypothetical protein DMG65_01030 [Candidatus Angelobacter sp. Gp1-AA117]|nr:MAG: hypothetical protein DMG65_01030 [Candidatus Angelobacter sp. Gp1-AA117]